LGESGPTGYSAGTWTCPGGTLGTSGTNQTVTVALGANVTCSITNDDNSPSLTLAKTVVNDSGGTAVAKDFTLSATGSSNPFSGTAGTSTTSLTGNTGSHTVTAGVAYSLGESGPTGYSAGTWTCPGGTLGTSGTNQTVTVALGANVTCSITNDDDKAQPGGTTAQSYLLFDSLTMSSLRTGAATPGTLTFNLWST